MSLWPLQWRQAERDRLVIQREASGPKHSRRVVHNPGCWFPHETSSLGRLLQARRRRLGDVESCALGSRAACSAPSGLDCNCRPWNTLWIGGRAWGRQGAWEYFRTQRCLAPCSVGVWLSLIGFPGDRAWDGTWGTHDSLNKCSQGDCRGQGKQTDKRKRPGKAIVPGKLNMGWWQGAEAHPTTEEKQPVSGDGCSHHLSAWGGWVLGAGLEEPGVPLLCDQTSLLSPRPQWVSTLHAASHGWWPLLYMWKCGFDHQEV